MASSPANNEASLGHDMLVEVLTRLPLKSFSRSRCVSKSWRGLASDGYVRGRLPLVVSGVVRLEPDDGPTYVSNSDDISGLRCADLGFLPCRSDSTLIDCCDGLLLFYSSLTSSFRACNPITGRHAALPRPARPTLLSIALFDPCRSRHFRVLSFARWLAQGAELEVYESESDEWRAREVHWGVETDALSATMRYSGGVLYILAQPNRMVAVRVDDDTMACRVVELPEATRVESCVGRMGGRLHYSVSDGSRVRAWMLEGEEWVLKHCVEIKMGEFRVMGFNPEREVVYMRVGTKLVAYDLCEERVEEAWELGEEKGHLMHVWVFPFNKNLEDLLS
ncbi:uncharacterized protein M6B38_274485 [Iris pallida]|uniref:F-box domain-containing protein n=1 Tax=Iris pallida TaxID=29817 RepID=A0AAX6I5K7_IRIPA|nr:uncharacterized protein M6B38_274485 [Iris pallida]